MQLETLNETNGFPVRVQIIAASEETVFDDTQSAAWMVLDAGENALIRVDGASAAPRPGDVYYIPRGAKRSVQGNVTVYAADNISGIASPDESASFRKIFGTTALCRGGSRTYYVSDGGLEFCRLNVSGTMPLNDGRALVLLPLCECTFKWADGERTVMPFESVVAPAELQDLKVICEDGKLMAACVSDRAALREELGYRSENVAGLI